MKKSTKKLLMALAIILIFGMSSIAFVATGLFGPTPQEQVKPLDGYVIDKAIDTNTESVYIQNQYTFLKFYYKNKDTLYIYVEQLPDIMSLPGGQIQLVVSRLEGDETRAEITNLNGNYEVTDLTPQGIFDALCERVLYTPTDCLLANTTQTGGNASAA